MTPDRIRPGLELSLDLLARTKRSGWRGTGIGLYRSSPVEECVHLYGEQLLATAGLESKVRKSAGLRWKRGVRPEAGFRASGPLSPTAVDRVFRDLARWSRDVRSDWNVGGAEFGLERKETAYGYRWQTRRDILLDAQGIHAAFFAWPRPPFRKADRERLEALGFYARVDRTLARLGLTGRWGPMSAARPNEWSADHWKRRIHLRQLPRLWKDLSRLRLPAGP